MLKIFVTLIDTQIHLIFMFLITFCNDSKITDNKESIIIRLLNKHKQDF